MLRDRPSTPDPENVAIAALGFLAVDDELTMRFLALSGLQADDLRAATAEPGFFVGLLDFILAHEPTVLAFAAHAGIRPEEIGQAREALAGESAIAR